MKKYSLIDAISLLDETYLDEYFEMQKAFQKRKKRTSFSKAAAILAAAILLIAGSITVFAARNPILTFFARMAEEEKSIRGLYTLGKIPDGYFWDRQELTKKSVKIIWKHETEGDIIFSQMVLSDAPAPGDGWEATEYMKLPIFYRETEQERIYRWNANEYTFILSLPLSISKEAGIYMIDCIEEKHVFDYTEPIPYNEHYHYYACTCCEACDEKRFKQHYFLSTGRDWKCEFCGYEREFKEAP